MLYFAVMNSQQEYLPQITIDCVIFGFSGARLQILLQKPSVEHAKGLWKLPGDHVHLQKTTLQTAVDTLQSLTGISNVYLEQLHTFDAIDRFPLERRLTVAYYALIQPENYTIKLGAKSSSVAWFPFDEIPDLPYDHNEIALFARERLRQQVRIKPIGFELLPEKFSLAELKTLYEVLLDTKLDKSNFRRKILRMNLLIGLEEFQQNKNHRLARLYKFDAEAYEELREEGFSFYF